MPNYDKYDDLLFQLEDDLKHPCNIIDGEYVNTAKTTTIINPLDGTPMFTQPDTQVGEIKPFLDSLAKCPKSGLHNPIRFMDKGVNRYLMLGEVSFQAAKALENPKVAKYFATLMQKVMPKSYTQSMAEVTVTCQFLKNFSGDQVRFLANGKTAPGDRIGQQTQDYRFPMGREGLDEPFNFSLEIIVLQVMSSLYMGNKPLAKSATKVAVVFDQFLSLLHWCGLPIEDVDLIHCSGPVFGELLRQGKDIINCVQFTGSTRVAKEILHIMDGRAKVEDSGFNWKILGPDYRKEYLNYVAWQSDQDAYSASGQKCSAQSILFAHQDWVNGNFFPRIKELASTRNLKDLTVGPVLSVTTEKMLEHVEKLLKIPGAKLVFGGKQLVGHKIPKCYGAIEPTAIYLPLGQVYNPKHFDLVTTEMFGPVQIVTTYVNRELSTVLDICERIEHNLTAAVVSNDPTFLNEVLGNTTNGTTYAGIKARTTGAPQNHWFGPSGPCAAGIGTRDAVMGVHGCQKGHNLDFGPIDGTESLVQS